MQAPGKKGCVPALVLGSFEHDSVILGSGVQAYAGAIVRGKEEAGIILWEKNKLCAAVDCREEQTSGSSEPGFPAQLIAQMVNPWT